MKRTRQTIYFIVIVVTAIWLLQYTVDRLYQKRVANKFTRVFHHEVDAEIMLFGSSVVYHQFDPDIISRETGKSAYNMGFSGMFFLQYNSLIREYLTYEKNCRLIVIGCDFDNLGRNDLTTRPDLFLAWLNNNNVYSSLHEIEPRKAFLARYLPGYKLTLLNKAFYLDIALARPFKDPHNGFEALNAKWEVTKREPFRSRYDESVFDLLKETVQAIRAKGIKLVFVIPPVFRDGYKLILNAEEIKARYRSLTGNGVYFIDYTSDSLCRSQDNFRNFTHLNEKGATAFSHTFAQDLLKIIHE